MGIQLAGYWRSFYFQEVGNVLELVAVLVSTLDFFVEKKNKVLCILAVLLKLTSFLSSMLWLDSS